MAARWFKLLVLLAVPGLGWAEPFGYAVNSDDTTANADQLLQIDLATGGAQARGQLPSRFEEIEGLALSPDGELFGVDSASKLLVRIDLTDATTQSIGALGFGSEPLDFGLTFSCSGALLLTAEQTQSLYEVDISTGQATVIGQSGGLGANMTALASLNGQVYGMAADSNTLHLIDPLQGTATTIGTLGQPVLDGGLAFDLQGQLWAILDTTGGGGPSPSQIVLIDPETAATTLVATTTDGIESLAIAPPSSNCTIGEPVPLNAPWALLLLLVMLAIAGVAAPRLN